MGVPEEMKVCKGAQKKVGYYESWSKSRVCNSKKLADIDFSSFTHIHYAFGSINNEGLIEVEDSEDMVEFSKLKNLYPKTKFIISIGGWAFNNAGTSHRFGNMVKNRENRDKFISSAYKFLQNLRLDGIDIDWEYPTAPDRGGDLDDADNYLTFIKELRGVMSQSSYSVSIAAPASFWYLKGFKIAEMSEYLDYIVYMVFPF